MKKLSFDRAVLLFCVSISLSFGAGRASAQGPAGAGASAVAQDSSRSHSPNPIKWFKKDSRNSDDSLGNRGDAEQKLTPGLQAKGILPANATAADACAPFVELAGCLAALHASHDLGLDFYCLRAGVTGVHTNADLSGCNVVDGERALGLDKAIRQMKPDANAKQATKDAEQQARDDLKGIGG